MVVLGVVLVPCILTCLSKSGEVVVLWRGGLRRFSVCPCGSSPMIPTNERTNELAGLQNIAPSCIYVYLHISILLFLLSIYVTVYLACPYVIFDHNVHIPCVGLSVHAPKAQLVFGHPHKRPEFPLTPLWRSCRRFLRQKHVRGVDL